MKHALVQESLSEAQVHPPGVFDRFKEASIFIANQALLDPSSLDVITRCVACSEVGLAAGFDRFGYAYRQCGTCHSLMATPRPSRDVLDAYWQSSEAAEIRRSQVFVDATKERQLAVSRTRAVMVGDLMARGGLSGDVAIMRPRDPYLVPALAEQIGGRCVSVQPLFAADDRDAVESISDLADESCSVLTLFDVLEQVASPAEIIKEAYRILVPGGRLVLTTRSGSGFDIQVLWNRANVFPLEHLNLISVEGMEALLTGVGFKTIELSTPGLLDLQVIQQAQLDEPALELPRFLSYLLSRDEPNSVLEFQTFLQAARLSSHMRVVAGKPVRSS